MLDNIRQRWPELERVQTEAADTSKVMFKVTQIKTAFRQLELVKVSFLSILESFCRLLFMSFFAAAGVQSARVQRSSGLHHLHVRAFLRLLQPSPDHSGRQPEGGAVRRQLAQRSGQLSPEPFPVSHLPIRCVCSETLRCLCGMCCVQEPRRRNCYKSSAPLWAGRRNSMQVGCLCVHAHSTCPICDYAALTCLTFCLRHAGMFNISQMKNRPMILIGG